RLTDGHGRTVDFRNTIIVMTSNIGSEHIARLSAEGSRVQGSKGSSEAVPDIEIEMAVREELKQHFRPEFLNRIDETIIFHRLGPEHLRQIVDIQLRHLKSRLAERGINLTLSDKAKDKLAKDGYDPVYGARPLKRLIQQEIENPLARKILAGEL